jgi:hypothetical protein
MNDLRFVRRMNAAGRQRAPGKLVAAPDRETLEVGMFAIPQLNGRSRSGDAKWSKSSVALDVASRVPEGRRLAQP